MTEASITDSSASFLDEYSEYVTTVAKPTKSTVDNILGIWQSAQPTADAESHTSRSPIALFESRIKSPESASDKIRRKSDSYPAGLTRTSLSSMADIVGCRVVVYFPSDLALVHEMVEASSDFDLVETPTAYYPEDRLHAVGLDDDVVVRGKMSGYRSIHYILRLVSDDETLNGTIFELQVRTLTDNVWAAIEHFLAYKPSSNIPASIHRQFELLAAHMGVVDAHFDVLNEEITSLQRGKKLRKRDKLSASTLPLVLRELRVAFKQGDLDRMLKMLASNGVSTVDDLRSLSRELNAEQIVNAYRQVFDKTPGNFTIVAIWALYAVNRQTGGSADPTALASVAEQYARTYRGLL